MTYKDYNDYELISLAQEHNEDALEIIYQKYKPLILKKSHRYLPFIKGVELCDLIQECYIKLYYAIKNFNQDNDSTFYTFFNICLDRYFISEYKRSINTKYKFLNEAIPLEESEEAQENLIDLIGDNTNNPETELTTNEDLTNLYHQIIDRLTDLEECVFILKIQNFSYKEIAEVLDKDIKSIDNSIQRIKNKINQLKYC